MLDPNEIETRFCLEDGMSFMDSIFTEPTEETQVKVGRVREVLDSLPPREADFVDLYFFRQLKQTDIARIFGVSQPTVCYRLQRATARIQFLLSLPPIEVPQLEEDLAGFLSDPLDTQIMVLMWKTTCQSEVAKRLGVSQGLVRHRFIRSLRRMQDNPKLVLYVDLFNRIQRNLNILREVQRPVGEHLVTHYLA
jgi:DNA-directed RNA polymerase specialized sigma24 family protein